MEMIGFFDMNSQYHLVLGVEFGGPYFSQYAVADSLNYLCPKWFVLVPIISLVVRATTALFDGNHMVFSLS